MRNVFDRKHLRLSFYSNRVENRLRILRQKWIPGNGRKPRHPVGFDLMWFFRFSADFFSNLFLESQLNFPQRKKVICHDLVYVFGEESALARTRSILGSMFWFDSGESYSWTIMSGLGFSDSTHFALYK